MLPRTCDATPRWNLPPENRDRLHVEYAVSIGLRGNATTMLVRTVRSLVCSSASALVANGSFRVSDT
nr:hypothetical protein [Nocardioides alcanivorans]